MSFRLYKDRLFHTTHNVANFDEFLLMLDIIDPSKSSYSLEEIMKLLLIEEVKRDVFKDFHSKPYKIFTEGTVDRKHMLNKISKAFRKNPGSLHQMVKDRLQQTNNPVETVDWIIEQRKISFQKFCEDPNKNYDLFINCIYKPTKIWQKNWVEFVRDFVDLASMMQLLPNYQKAGHIFSGFPPDFVPSKILVELKNKKEDEENFYNFFIWILMETKVRSSVLDISGYKQYNIQMRMFFCCLKLLYELRKRKLTPVEHKIFFGTLGCINSENEIEEAAEYIESYFKKNQNKKNDSLRFFNNQKDFEKEAGRISTGIRQFLIKTGLLEEKSLRPLLIDITEKGMALLGQVPDRTIFYKNYKINRIPIDLLNAHFLYRSYKKADIKRELVLNKNEFIDHIENITEETIEENIQAFIGQLDPKPYQVFGNELTIYPKKRQVMISPYLDFDSKDIIDFVINGGSLPTTNRNIIDVPSIDEIKKEYTTGNLINIIKEFSIGKVIQDDNNLLWLVKYFDDDTEEIRNLGILFLKFRSIDNEINKIIQFLETLNEEGINNCDIWILYIGILEEGDIKSIDQKLYEENIIRGIHQINCITDDCLILYLQYLYEKISLLLQDVEEINDEVYLQKTYIRCFFTWKGFSNIQISDKTQFKTNF